MFEVDEGKVQLVHKNERLEKHGDEDVLACDLNFVWETDNGCLAMFAPDLRSALYKKSDGSQPDLPGTSGPEHMTALRFPGLAPLKWSLGELIGGELTFHHGTTAKSHIKIDITKLCKYRLECKEGGTVVVGFQVQCRPSEQQSGKLSKFLTDKHCVVSVIPPNARRTWRRGSSAGRAVPDCFGSGGGMALPVVVGPLIHGLCSTSIEEGVCPR